jgi:hypothetical protein
MRIESLRLRQGLVFPHLVANPASFRSKPLNLMAQWAFVLVHSDVPSDVLQHPAPRPG